MEKLNNRFVAEIEDDGVRVMRLENFFKLKCTLARKDIERVLNIIHIILEYIPVANLEEETVFAVPFRYLEDVQFLAKLCNAKIEVMIKRRPRLAYVKWIPKDIINNDAANDDE
ncbi:hypothetical protein M164_0146 [Sulfolobus islandicus M.16.4]|uniref:Uncharacterized protein n=2 Tax=Saccharolobus islandicus TaxID=43080 RepID=C4KK39_SACI6|nr:hypothetical protein M164_0146 [Sulfolobus islandicus M.16.4]